MGGGSQQGGGQLPINQRGAVSGDLSEDSYIIDRWQVQAQLQNVSYSIDADGVSITTSAGNQGLKQFMEVNRLIPGETYTSTVLLADGTLMTKTFTLSEQGSAGMYYDGSQWSCAIVPVGTLWAYFPVIHYVGDLTIKIAAAKLENGPTQTLAYQDEDGNWQLFETPDYAEQLAKCQRYYIPIDGFGRFPSSFSSPPTTLHVFIPTPVTMRSIPTVLGITSLSARVYTGASNSQSLSISDVLKTETGVLIMFSCTWPDSYAPAAYSNAIVVFEQRGALSAEL